MAFYGQNQLQFNLACPPMASHLSAQFHKPEPIKFEKLRCITKDSSHVSKDDEQFMLSSVSQDRMSLAVQLAKRDVKKQMQEQNVQSRNRSTSPKSSKSKTKIIYGKEYWDRQRKWQSRPKKPLVTKEHDKNKQVKVTGTQTPPRMSTRNNLPATTNSPPTRDTDRYPHNKGVTTCAEPSDEVEKLQLEMENYLHQIEVIEEKAINEQNVAFLQHHPRSRRKEGYLSDEEDDDRRMIRADEHATRAARNIYNLRQQVRQIQREIMTLGPDRAKHTKKSQTMAKLAAAHRGAVRTIQSFVTNLPNHDLRHGLPPSYHELALLIRQLTQLSCEIKQGEHTKVQEELTSMLDNIEKLNTIWSRKKLAQQQQQQQQQQENSQQSLSRVSQPPFQTNVHNHQKSVRRFGKENKLRSVHKTFVKSNDKLKVTRQQSSPTPERRSVLRAGLEALMKETEMKEGLHGMSWSVPVVSNRPQKKELQTKKSLLLPAKLQAKRDKIQRVHFNPTDSHFADPTISANMRSVQPLKNPITDEERSTTSQSSSPRRSCFSHSQRHFSSSPSPSQSSTSPWRPAGLSPAPSPATKQRSRSLSPAPSRSSNRVRVLDVDEDMIRQLFPSEDEKPAEQRRGRPVSRYPESPVSQRQKQSLHKSDVRGSQKPQPHPIQSEENEEFNDMLLNDILADTVRELQHFEQDDDVRHEAVRLQDLPTLSNLQKRLEEMEQEQNDIRRRWASVIYEDPKPKTKYFTTNELLSDRPGSPPAIEVSRIRTNSIDSRPHQFAPQAMAEPVMFTVSQPETVWHHRYVHDKLHRSQMEPETVPSFRRARTQLSLPQTVVERIVDNKEKFEHHLKKMSHHPFGRFDPWKLVEEITDQLMDECFRDVADEMEDINDAIANNMYKSEFIVTDGQSLGNEQLPDSGESPESGQLPNGQESPESRQSPDSGRFFVSGHSPEQQRVPRNSEEQDDDHVDDDNDDHVDDDDDHMDDEWLSDSEDDYVEIA